MNDLLMVYFYKFQLVCFLLFHKEWIFLKEKNLEDKYSLFSIAGGTLAVTGDSYKNWKQTFLDNLKITITNHKIHKIIVINHRDCRMAKEVFGDEGGSDEECKTN